MIPALLLITAMGQFLPDGIQPMPRHASAPAFLFAAPAASAPSSITPTAGPAFSCVRGSTGTYQTSASGIATAAANTCRVDYRGLEVEESRTNTAKQSPFVDNAAWTKSNATALASQCVFLDGTTSMASITQTASNGQFFQSTTNSSGTMFVGSGWISTVSGTATVSLGIERSGGTSTSACACLAPSGCTIVQAGAGNIDCVSQATATTTPTRFSALITTSASATTMFPEGEPNTWGTGSGGVACFGGMQSEAGAFPTSYIPTTTTAVTRAADQIDLGAITLSGTPSLSATVNLEGLPASGTATALSATDGTTALTLAVTTTGTVKCSYGATSDTTTGTIAAGTASKIVCKYDGTTLSACIGSTCHGTTASLSITAAQTHVYLGWDGTGNYANAFFSTACAGKKAGQC